MSVRVRYAPSPTGSPHIGNIRTAVFNWLFARHEGGKFIARLEDTDRSPERYRPESIAEIESSLNFLGVTPDEWWVNGEPERYIQSHRLPKYQDAAEKLISDGNAYPCFCTTERLSEMRAEQQARGVPSGYDKRCRRLSPDDRARYIADGLPYTVRLAVPMEGKTTYRDLVYGEITFENKLIDDQVLLKSTGWPTYHLAVVVDDHDLEITHVIRGEDWQPSTPKQVLLYQMLGYDMPKWVHCPLIVGIDKKKLSKRHGSTQFSQFIDEGYLPEALFNYLVLCGWSAGEENREVFSKEEIVERFTIEGISKSPAVFDYDKLRWLNGEYIRACSLERLTQLCLPYFQRAGFVVANPTESEFAYLLKVVPLVAERLKVLSEVAGFTGFFFVTPQEFEEKGRKKWLMGDAAIQRLEAAIAALVGDNDSLSVEEAENAANAAAASCNSDRGPIIHTLRVAVTGKTVGPGLFETLNVLGRKNVLSRLQFALQSVEV